MRPTVAEVAGRIVGADEQTILPLYEAAWHQQCELCCVDPYSPDLAEALHRRVGDLWASKAHTFGVLDTGSDFGVQTTPYFNSEIERLEGPHRKIPVW
jgi:hypothetical protein